MNLLMTIVMYVMWAVTLIAILATTFTNFAFLDLNIIAIVLLTFSLVNTFFITSAGKKKTPSD
jgi:hypothetical protein